MKNKGLIILIIVFVLGMVGAYILYNTLGDSVGSDYPTPSDTPANSGVNSGTQATKPAALKAPDFTVYDQDGNAVKLSDYFGKPLVLNFWASWCGPCRSEMPAFENAYQQLGSDITFLMVNATGGRETLNSAKAFLQNSGYTLPVFFDTEMDAAMTYQVYSLPTTYFIDADGYLVNHAIGALSESMLQRNLSLLLSR